MIAPITALNAQLSAVQLIQWLRDSKSIKTRTLQQGWEIDRHCLPLAAPFAWSLESTAAVMQAAKSVPPDTLFIHWNLPNAGAWWYFEQPLDIPTTDFGAPIRALNLSWIRYSDGTRAFRVAVWTDDDGGPRDEAIQTRRYEVIPSQTWMWMDGESLAQMMERCRAEHLQAYGASGKFRGQPAFKLDGFMAATERVSSFVVAAVAWLNQKILVEETVHIERHRRKDFVRITKREPSLRVVHLRKMDYPQREHTTDGKKIEWSCHWVVSGHWRNVACGPGFSDRRLTYIHAFPKGDPSKPLKVHGPTVYEVSR